MPIIKNGLIVTGDQVFPGDLLIKNGKVVEIGTGFTKISKDILDAKGKYVLPGGIDAAVHFNQDRFNTTTTDDFESGTKAAAMGGTTTVLSYALSQKSYYKKGLEAWLRKSEGKSAVDYGFHLVLTNYNERSLNDIPAIMQKGVTSFICYFNNRAMALSVGHMYKILEAVSKENGIVGIHVGSGSLTEIMEKQKINEGRQGAKSHSQCRPPQAEASAADMVLALAEMTQSAVFILHLSSAHALEKLKIFRDRGHPVYGETCPHYLILSDDRLSDDDFNSARYVCSPPLRSAWHMESLWRGIISGDIHFISSDHLPFNFDSQKSLGKRDFRKIPSGMPGIEDRFSLMYGCGVAPGKISLTRMVQLLSSNPAKLFGLFPTKGTIAPGSDADLVILDPERKTKISSKTHHMNVDYNPYEGMELPGAVEHVFLRGNYIVKSGKFIGRSGDGQFLKRSIPTLV